MPTASSRADRRLLPAWLALAALCCSGQLCADWQEYRARYEVYRNGSLAGTSELRLERQGERWMIRSETRGTQGLARLLGANDSELSEGRMLDGRFRPDRFIHHARMAGLNDRWQADFDWIDQRVVIRADDDETALALSPGAVDGLALKLELQRRLRAGEEALEFQLVSDERIKHQQYRPLQPQWLETRLGCLHTLPVERVRSTGSTRYTRAWHAPQLDYIAVRMEHGKTGGEQLELRISGLVLGGREQAPVPACTPGAQAPQG